MNDIAAVRALFLEEVRRRNISVKEFLEDGRIALELQGGSVTISLENIVRECLNSKDAGIITRFVDSIERVFPESLSWEEAKPGLRFSAEPADSDFEDTVFLKITDTICRVLVYITPEGTDIRWINRSELADWEVTEEQANEIAGQNMAALLNATPLHIERMDGLRLGMFRSDSVFKAALIFSPNFKDVFSRDLGWPVYAVLPCRDFGFFFPVEDDELIGRVGRTVVDEYKRSAYPITPDVLEISDSGITAIGSYPLD